MTKKFKINRIFWLFLALFAFSLTLLPTKATVRENSKRNTDLAALNDLPQLGNPKMEYALSELFEIYLAQGVEKAKEFAKQRKIDMEDNRVRVVVEGHSPETGRKTSRTSLLEHQIRGFGARIEATYNQLIQSWTPVGTLQNIAGLPSVKYLRLPLKPRLLTISEGVAKTGADQWQSLKPYRTQENVKVCILDAGFEGYESLLGLELPSTVTAKSFRADGNIQASIKHGTACAEIVHDMAPEANLYLVNFETDVEQHNAVDWLISEGVKVISYSIGWTNAGRGDGTGPICEDVKKAANAGITWVSAAGNEAKDHWEGIFNDPDGDGWHNFTGKEEILQWWVPANNYVAAYLNWDDWGTWNGMDYSGSAQNYDLYLYLWQGGSWHLVDKSANLQTGTQWPVEGIGYYRSSTSTYWGIAIKKANATRDCKLELFAAGNQDPIELNVPEGSLTIPADSDKAVAVGATDWRDDSYHTYSSRGPTTDGRIKPDFSAPSGVSTVSYGAAAFLGTSASTPHVAGAFALLSGKTPYSLEQIYAILQNRAVDLGAAGKDNQFGYGRLNLKKKQ
jgi:hypothetical protein